jgi:TRAP-type C4-dicarboxylate transport system permease small subunit
MALAYALTRGGHIRVTLVLTFAPERVRFIADLFSLALCGLISAAAVYFMASLNYQSFRFGDKSPGILAIPIWIAQLPLTIGLAVLTIAFADLFVRTLHEGKPLPIFQANE